MRIAPRPIRSATLPAALLTLMIPMLHAAPLTRVDLHAGWEFRQAPGEPASVSSQWRPATVPGDVHLDLLANKLIPEPFSRDNEAKLQWISDADWQYRTTMEADATLLKREHVELVFEGLDSEADVLVNGHAVLHSENSFRGWRVDVKPYLRAGGNQLEVNFTSPMKSGPRLAALDKYRGTGPARDKTYLRKPAYEYGWDWGPIFVTSGIWRPVHVEAWDGARIDDLYVRQRAITASLARIEAEVTVVANAAGQATIELAWQRSTAGSASPGGDKGSSSARQTVDLTPGVNHITLPVTVEKPALWYPAGYGEQAMYTWTARVATGGHEDDTRSTTTGLRSVELRRNYDKFGRSFEFVVNGIPVYAKGADVIPFDSFPSRVTEAQYRHILQSARDSNMNMVRLWGGGYYETEAFYRTADELGIMIWHDFMFGNDWQPGSTRFREEVAHEAEYQVTRLRNHPSIVLWCGNNETEISLSWDTNKIVHSMDTAGRVRIWQDYLLLFSSVLPRVVERLNPETPYWPSSPSADYEDDLPAGQHTGDAHNWDVWHGRVPFSTYETHHERFVSEYGFQSFPEMRTIESFTDAADRASIFTPVMLSHQKNNEGNSLIQDYMLKDYREPKDFASFLYASQVLQAEGIKIGAEHLRRIRPENMGGLYWQLNDCWPVASWASIDYFGRWKALQFYARRFYAPILVSPHLEDGGLAIWAVSDRPAAVQAELRVRLMNFSGAVLREEKTAVTLPALSSAVYQRLPLAGLLPGTTDLAQVIAVADLSVGGELVSRNFSYLVPTKAVQLPQTTVAAELTAAPGGFRLRLTSPVLARDVHVALNLPEPDRPNLGDADTLSDDYVTLLPNEPMEIMVHTAASEQTLRSAMKVMSLADAFAPAGAPSAPAKP